MRPDGMPGSYVCLQTSTICSRRSARLQIRGNNIKWHSHVDYIIKKYYQRGLVASNYQGQDWNHLKITWSKHSSKAWWSNQHRVLCVRIFRSYSNVGLWLILKADLQRISIKSTYKTALDKLYPSLLCGPLTPLQCFPLFFFHFWLLSSVPACHNLSLLASSVHGV